MTDAGSETSPLLPTGTRSEAPISRTDERDFDVSGSVVPVLFSTNSRFLQHTAVCLTSLLVNNPDLFFKIVMVSHPTEKLDEEKLRRSLRLFPNHSLVLLEFAPPAETLLPLNPGAHYTMETWTRLWVAKFFPETVSRVLYLDGDIVVVGSIAALWKTDLDGALLGAVDIPGAERDIPILQNGINTLGMRPEDGYFNAGVLLIDLKQWRETRALATVLAYVAANPDRLPNVDQDALNACFHKRRKRLDYKWNVIRPFFREPSTIPLTRSELDAVRQEARIIHFNGGLKPWSYFSDHPRRNEYEKYLRMTEWRDYVAPDRTPLNMLRKGISAVLPTSIKGVLKTVGRHLSF